jgi:transglutaminase-like putative cysteine protease
MKLRVLHRTTYYYRDPATTSHHEARLTPRQSEFQKTITFDLDITPTPNTRRNRLDYFGNRMTYFGLTEPHQKLEIVANSMVETSPVELPDFRLTPAWETVVARLKEDPRRDVLQATQMRFDSPLVKTDGSLEDYARSSFSRNRPTLDGVRELMDRIFSDFTYDPSATDLSTSVATVFQTRRGVCQDFAHVMIGCLRSLGLAARYTSGYLRTRPPEGKPRLIGADASHAWVSVWIPDHGWVDFDPTNNLCPSDEHITLAFGRDFADVTPVRGVILGGANHDLEVSVDVEAMDEGIR